MDYKILFEDSALKSLKKLDNGVVRRVLKRVGLLRKNPYLGKPLGNKMGMNLTGYYKLYACEKKLRIVYTISEKEVLVTVVIVGKREKGEVYENVLKSI